MISQHLGIAMRRSILLSLALAGAGLCLSVPAAAQDLLAAASSLAPGRFSWDANATPKGAIRIVISIPQQRAFVYRGDALIGVSTVSTGKEGYDTPVGIYPILQKREKHFSNLYESAPMPWMQRLTWDGIALHAGQIPGHPASHGCVRLPAAFARQLFALTSVGAIVEITDADDIAPPAIVPAEPAPIAPDTMALDQRPDAAPAAGAVTADPAVRLASTSANAGS